MKTSTTSRSRRRRHLLPLVALGAVAVVGAGAREASRRAEPQRRERPAPEPAPLPAAAPPAPEARRLRTFGRTKALLTLTLVAGILAYVGGAGTFAGFTAETTNPNDSVSSGTLTLNDTVNSGTACASLSGASANNVNPGCSIAIAPVNAQPGVLASGATAKITVQNTGSLDASKLYLWAPYTEGVLSSSVASGSTVSTLTLSTTGGPNGIEGTVNGGDLVVVSYGSASQTFKVGAAGAAPGATSIPIVNDATYPNVASATFSAGATVTDTSSNTSVDNTNCYDQKTATSSVSGATKGTDLNFNPILHNPFCQAALFFVQEIGTNENYCWYGSGAGSASGMCNAPINANLAAGATIGGSTSSLSIGGSGGLRGNVKSGDTITITEGANTTTCTAGGAAYITATSISVGSCAPSNTFTTAASIVDSTTATTLSTDTTDTLSHFDLTRSYANKLELTPVSANGTTAATGTDLGHAGSGTDTRTFYVGVYLPNTGATSQQNWLQGLMSTFGITWHIDQ